MSINHRYKFYDLEKDYYIFGAYKSEPWEDTLKYQGSSLCNILSVFPNFK